MNLVKRFFKEEEGLATLEIVLICVVLIGIVFIFKNQIMLFIDNIMKKINELIGTIESGVGEKDPA